LNGTTRWDIPRGEHFIRAEDIVEPRRYV
jgi:hypothetical protein